MKFVDKYGTVISKSSSPFSSNLEMEYKTSKLKIIMMAYSSPFSNGSCSAKVTYNGKIVFDSAGNFTSTVFNTSINKYKPGAWEKLIK